MNSTGRTILWATLMAGTLDILSAFLWSVLAGGDPARVLPSVASGPFGDSIAESPAAPAIGLAVHFGLMLVMAAIYVQLARWMPQVSRHWIVAGLIYGFAIWIVMYWIVLPVRFGAPFPSNPAAIARQLVSHMLLVGLPIAWLTARGTRA